MSSEIQQLRATIKALEVRIAELEADSNHMPKEANPRYWKRYWQPRFDKEANRQSK